MYEEIIVLLAKSFQKYKIPYMLIGGQAVLIYGEPRFTRDIDISIGLDETGFPAIRKICEELSLKILPAKPEDFIRETMVLPCLDKKTGIRVDFIFTNSEYEKKALERIYILKIKDIPVNFASKEDIIILKIVAGRERDLEDVRSILLKQKELDIKYISRCLKDFDSFMDINTYDKWKEIYR